MRKDEIEALTVIDLCGLYIFYERVAERERERERERGGARCIAMTLLTDKNH